MPWCEMSPMEQRLEFIREFESGLFSMTDLAARLTQKHGVPVIDGVASAVKLAEAFGALGLKTSKIGAYASPGPKAYLGAFAAFGPR